MRWSVQQGPTSDLSPWTMRPNRNLGAILYRGMAPFELTLAITGTSTGSYLRGADCSLYRAMGGWQSVPIPSRFLGAFIPPRGPLSASLAAARTRKSEVAASRLRQ